MKDESEKYQNIFFESDKVLGISNLSELHMLSYSFFINNNNIKFLY